MPKISAERRGLGTTGGKENGEVMARKREEEQQQQNKKFEINPLKKTLSSKCTFCDLHLSQIQNC